MRQGRGLFIYNTFISWLPESVLFLRFRVVVLTWIGCDVGKDVRLGRNVKFYGDGVIKIGNGVSIQHDAIIESQGRVEIGESCKIGVQAYVGGSGTIIIKDNCQIGPKTLLEANENGIINIGRCVKIAHCCAIKTSTHCIDVDGESIAGETIHGSINIGDGTWVCAGVIVIPNVGIGIKCVCGAGAVVTKNVDDYTLVGGVPACVKKNYKHTLL